MHKNEMVVYNSNVYVLGPIVTERMLNACILFINESGAPHHRHHRVDREKRWDICKGRIQTRADSIGIVFQMWDEVGKLKWLDNAKLNVVKSEIQLKWYNLPLFAALEKGSWNESVFLCTKIIQTMNTRPLFIVTELVDNGLRTYQIPVHTTSKPWPTNTTQECTNVERIFFYFK